MKSSSKLLTFILIVTSLFAPNVILPNGGLSNAHAQEEAGGPPVITGAADSGDVSGPPLPGRELSAVAASGSETSRGFLQLNGLQATPYQSADCGPDPGDPQNPSNSQTNDPNNDTSQNSDPVSMADGEFTVSATDITVPGVVPLKLTRCFTSNMGYFGPVGVNWDFNYNRSLDIESNAIYYSTGQGYRIQMAYTSQSPVQALSTVQTYLSLVQDSSGNYTVTNKEGAKDIFDQSGRLLSSVDRNGNTLTYSRDGMGRLIAVEDAAHNTSLTFGLDTTTGRITSVTDSNGRIVTYSYDDNGDLTQVTEPVTTDFPEGTSTQYTYDSNYRLLTVIDGKGNTVVSNTYEDINGSDPFKVASQQYHGGTATWVYDDANNHVTYTDYKGFVTEYYNDGNKDITRMIVHTAGLHSGEPSTYETDYAYDSNFRKIQQTNPDGSETQWTYGNYSNLLSVTNISPSGTTVNGSKGSQVTSATTTYTYEPRFNQVASVTDPNGNVTTYDYGDATSNPAGNLLSVTYPTTAAGTATEYFSYNSLGQVLTDTAPDGTVTKNVYDSHTGYLTETIKDYGTGKLNATTQYTYDTYGNVASVEDANNHTVTTTYNALDQVTEIDGASGEVEQFTYDADSKVIVGQKQAPDSGTWQKTVNVYDTVENLIATRVYSDATTYLETDYTYDANGNKASVTDPLGHTTSIASDERDKPYLTTDPTGKTTQLDFDGNGHTIKLTDELGNVTTYAYDGLGKLEQKTFPDSSYQTWSYDANGNVISLRTTAGNTIAQTYDTRNRMLTQSYTASSGPSTITNAYDIMGRLLTATEGGTSLTYVYDNLGRNTSFTDQAGRVSSFTYDLVGNRTSTTYPTSVTVNRAHDSSNRLTTLQDGSNATQATYSYDILDRPTGITLANSTSVSYSYDLMSRLTGVSNTLTSGNRNYSYVYNNAGLRSSETEPRGTISYGYTNRNELNSITEPSGSPFSDQSFAYDAGWNRSSWTVGSATPTTYAVNNLDQYTTVSGSTAPTWNSDGGLSVFNGNTYTYDALGRLTQVSNASGIFLFSYDPLGRRVKKVDENTSGAVLATYQYHYDGSEVAVEYQPSTTWTYYLGLGIDQVVMRTDGTNKQWYYHSALGSVSAVADNSGNVMEAYEYDAQGDFQITDSSGSVLTTTGISNDLMFTGREYDAESGNYFYRARYYNPTLGRFISRDPLSGVEFSQGTNLYAYCKNNFVNLTDPTGKCWLSDLVNSWDQDVDDFMNVSLNADLFMLGASADLVGGFGTGVSVGAYMSFNSDDLMPVGLYATFSASGGLDASINGNISAQTGSAADMGGLGSSLSAGVDPITGSANFDSSGNLVGGTLSAGPGMSMLSTTDSTTYTVTSSEAFDSIGSAIVSGAQSLLQGTSLSAPETNNGFSYSPGANDGDGPTF